MCFIDFEKAFDTVRLICYTIAMLKQIYMEDIKLTTNLYQNQIATVKARGEETKWIDKKKSKTRVCSLAGLDLSLRLRVKQELEDMERISIRGKNVNNIRYADDTVLLADSEVKLQALVNKMQKSCERKELKINAGKI